MLILRTILKAFPKVIVMLGEKPQAPRNNGDGKTIERLFPIEKNAPAPTARVKAPQKKKTKKLKKSESQARH